jgi:metallo-beta-lactamase class B
MAAAAVGVLSLTQVPTLHPDSPKHCANCDAWNRDRTPFQIYGNTYYVGTAELSAVLVTSPDGHILLDAGLPQSAPLIDAHVRALGFMPSDIKFITTSHAHFDHVGGVAALQRFTGATVAASPSTKRALLQGSPVDDDPQKTIPDNGFPRVAAVKELRDGEVLRVGNLAVTAHFTPGHTPGSTTWTWQSCGASGCKNIVYADSLNPISADDFKFTAASGRVSAFQASIGIVGGLPCDIIVSVHPDASNLGEKLAARAKAPAGDPFIDTNGCRTYAENARKALNIRLAAERK